MPGAPKRLPPPAYLRVIRTIDRATTWTATLFILLLVPLVLSNAIEVFMRYVLGKPTAWALEVNVMSFGALFMLGAAFALLKGAHVRTDMFWERFSPTFSGASTARLLRSQLCTAWDISRWRSIALVSAWPRA